MLFSLRQIDNFPNVYFNDTAIEWVSEIKYLGVIIDSKLKFNHHINHICSKLSGLLGLLYSMNHFMPIKTMMSLYHSLVGSTVNQNIIIWGGAPKCHTSKIFTSQNKIIRIILNVRYNQYRIPLMRTNDMYKKLNILQFKDIYKLSL